MTTEKQVAHDTATRPPKIVHGSPSYRWFILAIVMLATLPVAFDATVLHIAIPRLTQALGATTTEVLWIIDIYPLLMAGLLVPMGTLADRVGNRRILMIGLMLFGGASLLAAFASTAAVLLLARVLLALGGAMIMPCVLGLIRRSFTDEAELGFALGLWSMAGAAGSAIGPLIGGALLEYFEWGAVFLINIPIVVVVVIACYWLLPHGEALTEGKWRIGQALLLTTGIVTTVYAIKASASAEQSIGWVILMMACGALMLAVFVSMQLRSREPMLNLSLFSHPEVVAGVVMAIVAMAAVAGVELTLAQELQYVLGKTPWEAGVVMLPLMVGVAVGGVLAGYLSKVLGLRCLAVVSLAVAAMALGGLAWADFHNPGVVVAAMLLVLGLMLSASLTASSIAIMSAVDESEGGAAGSLEATGFELGAGLGIVLFGVFISGLFGRAIRLPSGISAEQSAQASRSLGDVYLVANQLAEEQAVVLIEAGKEAFVAIHSALLSSAAVFILLLAAAVFFMLAGGGKKAQ